MRFRVIVAAAFATISPCLAADGNWIAVVAPGLQEAIHPLVVQRKSEGWQVKVIVSGDDPSPAIQTITALAADGRPCCVLLAGDLAPGAGTNRVPPGTGVHLRMKGLMTDLPWSAGGKTRNIEVGRLPARNSDEARAMVRKTLTWPADQSNRDPFPRAGLIAGHHGAPSALEGMANGLTNSLTLRLAGQLPPAWRFDGAADIDGSHWQVSTAGLTNTARRMMTESATFLAYMGHSGLDGAVSRNSLLLSSADWRALPTDGPRPGLFFTCGCHSCEPASAFESYGFAAMRSHGGPPAVIGSSGETWSSMGYLAIAGLIDRLSKDPAPVRLGSLWLGVQQGIATGKISATTFAMLDRADGTGGKVPLAQQRLEHLESWMLLGDPAMPLLPPPPGIRINPPAAPMPGGPLTITGNLPAESTGAAIRVTLERHPSAVRRVITDQAAGGGRTTGITISSANATATGNTFSVSMDLPSPVPPKPWTLRVETTQPPRDGGVLLIR